MRAAFFASSFIFLFLLLLLTFSSLVLNAHLENDSNESKGCALLSVDPLKTQRADE